MLKKEEFKQFRVDFKDAVKELEKKYGIGISLGTISYRTNDFGVKMTAIKVGKGVTATPLKVAETHFKNVCLLYGLKPSHFGAEVIINSERFTIVGINRTGRKNTLLIKSTVSGKEFKTDPMRIASQLK